MKKVIGVAALAVLSVGALTGCGEVNQSGGCNPNPAGGYDFYFIVSNDVASQPDESIIVSNDGLNPAPVTGDPHPLAGVEITRGNSFGFFFNNEPTSTMTYVVQTHPISDPSATSLNYLTVSC